MNISELVIYRNLKHEDLFEDMAGLMGLGKEGQKADPFACAGELVELAVEYGFEGNLWHCFLALCLADNEKCLHYHLRDPRKCGRHPGYAGKK